MRCRSLALRCPARDVPHYHDMLRRNHGDDDAEEDDDFYSGGGSGEQQRLLAREQDDTMRTLGSSVQRVHGLALRVNEEITSQTRLIDAIDEEVGQTDSKLRGLHTKLSRLTRDGDRGKYCIIALLLVVLVVLVLMILS